MEWVDGPSLQRRIAASLPTPRQAARIVRDLARALEAVHSLGIIHRDIKPDNVLLAGVAAGDWDLCVPKLADFGLARPADVSQQRLAEQHAGVAARSMSRLTGELIEQMIRRSRPDDQSHLEFLRQIREEFFHWPLDGDSVESLGVRVKGLRRVAGLFCDVSHYDDTLACHELSLELLEDLAARRPQDPRLITEQLHSLHVQRVCLHDLRRMDEAVTSARRSVALLAHAPAP